MISFLELFVAFSMTFNFPRLFTLFRPYAHIHASHSTFQFKFINANIEQSLSSLMSRPNTLSFMTPTLQFSFLISLILHHFQLDFEATNFSIYITLHIETQINVLFTIHGLYDAKSAYHFPQTTARHRGRSSRCARASHVTPQYVF